VAQLVKENEILKGIVKTRKSDKKAPTINNMIDLFPMDTIPQGSDTVLVRADYRLVSAIQASQRAFCITNPALPDNPIVFASKGFLELTRYRLDQVIGRNCRFLHGPETDKRQINAMKKGILSGIDTSVCVLNYRGDGTTFYNQVFIAPLRDKSHRIVNYIGVQVEVEVCVLMIYTILKIIIIFCS
jgi:PAS domain S-box-containing protein